MFLDGALSASSCGGTESEAETQTDVRFKVSQENQSQTTKKDWRW
jgi:hypothetical protein